MTIYEQVIVYTTTILLLVFILLEKGDYRRLGANLWVWLKALAKILITPKMLLTFGIAWMITNGWSYLFVFFGIKFGIKWMLSIGVGYQAFLWLPFTAEKIITVAIAIWLGKIIFPHDHYLQDKLAALSPKNIIK